jgi:hypothetical protein
VVMNNFFAPLRDLRMENAEPSREWNSTKTPEINDSPGHSPSYDDNIEGQLNLSPQGTKVSWLETGTRVTIKSMVDYNAIQNFWTERNFHFFIFYTKADKPINAIIKHLPGNISTEDITVALQETDYVISVKQMTTKCPTSEGGITPSLSLPTYASKK